ncbi:MAG: cob(I)yrinic acid a,c-diamide adenosyltransferase, partial [Candidatus Neomarinimicrobiota bacterium]
SLAEKLIKSGKYRLVILDEINVAIYFGLISTDRVLNIVKNRPENVDILLTGRYAPKELIDLADLVTEMVEIKHYYRKGIKGRKGFEY